MEILVFTVIIQSYSCNRTYLYSIPTHFFYDCLTLFI